MRTLSPEALSHLVDSLRKVRAEYAITESPIKQRTCWINELECVLRTLIQVPEISNEGLLIPLGHLYDNLIDLNFGTADPGLQSHKPAHRHPNPRSVRFRALAAAASELLKRNGATAADADGWVAQLLGRLGYRQ